MDVMTRRQVLDLLPERLATRIQAVRSRNHQVRYLRTAGFLALNQRFIATFGLSVRTGPFQGMRYPTSATKQRHVAPRLVGSYESCLHRVIKEIQERRYEHIVDIGCAEGYYAVGFAMIYPDAHVFAFDAEPRELKLCRELKDLNRVSNLSLGAFCDSRALSTISANRRSLILSDCEGYESRLFTEETVASLARTDFLIELHELASPGVTERLSAIFNKTHQVSLIESANPGLGDYPWLAKLGESAELCLCELRDPSQQWLYAIKRNSIPRATQVLPGSR